MFPRSLRRAVLAVLLIFTAAAAPAAAAPPTIDVVWPAAVDGTRYSGHFTWWEIEVTHDADAAPVRAEFWLTRDAGHPQAGGTAADPLQGWVEPGADDETTWVGLDLSEESIGTGHDEASTMHLRLVEEDGDETELTVPFTGDGQPPARPTIDEPRDAGPTPAPVFAGGGVSEDPRVDPFVTGDVYDASGVRVATFAAPVSGTTWRTDALRGLDGAPLAALPNGTYSTWVRRCDSADNCDSSATRWFTVGPTPIAPPIWAPGPPPPPPTHSTPGRRPDVVRPSKARDVVAKLATDTVRRLGGRLAGVRRAFRLAAVAPAVGMELRVCVFLGGTATAKACLADRPRNLLARGSRVPSRYGAVSLTVRPTPNARRLLSGRRRARVRIVAVQDHGVSWLAPVATGRSATLKR